MHKSGMRCRNFELSRHHKLNKGIVVNIVPLIGKEDMGNGDDCGALLNVLYKKDLIQPV